ncbi:MAG: glutathione S-transferase family protein [Xanthobacteraceae bacterium]
MALTLYYMSGSPYAWRVWLALEHKRIAYELKTLSYDGGDFQRPEFLALNPRHRVPVIVDDGFALYESAAIIEYLEERWPQEPRLFSVDLRERAVQRRMVREADQYFAAALEYLATEVLFTPRERWSKKEIAAAGADVKGELAMWESTIAGDYLAGALSAVDFTFFPQVALVQRIGMRNPGLLPADLIGPKVSVWMRRMEALPATQKTWPPHWRG